MLSIKKVYWLHVLFLAVFLMAGSFLLSGYAIAETAGGEQMPAAEEAAPAPIPGDPDMGRKLYTGEIRFQNGGPPCISCHDIGVGGLGGGTLGPNLMLPNEKYGVGPAPTNPLIAAGWINNPATPVMGAVFSRKNVTDEEVDNLRAFFKSLPERTSSKTGVFVGVSAAGFVGVLIFFGIIWGGRYRNRCGGTAHEAIWRNYGGKGGQR